MPEPRVCPTDPDMKTCWWVMAGNPHTSRGHGCICLIPVERWVPHPDSDAVASTAIRQEDA